MRNLRRIVILILSISLAALVVFTTYMLCFRGEKEPTYEGMTLSQMIKIADTQFGSRDKAKTELAAEGIHHIGTNAIPFFLKWMQYDEPELITKARESTEFRPGKYLIPDGQLVRANVTPRAFWALGSNADYAISDLAHLINLHPSGEVASRAIFALANMRRPGALSILMATITNLQSPLRRDAILAVGEMGSNALPIVPLLIDCLKDTNDLVFFDAGQSLGELQMEPEIVVPILISNADPNQTNRYLSAISNLRLFGTNASQAIPLLRQALDSEDLNVRGSASISLGEIDPTYTNSLFN
jgi:HEAT repeats